jgi:tetratricopeptide (TPR) repeat protein
MSRNLELTSIGKAFIFYGAMIFIPSILLGQEKDKVKAELFREVEAAFEQARQNEAPLLAPNRYAAAQQLYRRAEEDYNKGEKVKKIRERVEEALKAINEAVKAAKVSRVALEELLAARKEAAAKRDYITLVPSKFGEAERQFNEAVAAAEKGDVASARGKADEAIKLYREMTVEALLLGPLKNAEARLKQARAQMPKENFKKAERELAQLKKAVEKNKDQKFTIAAYDNQVLAQIAQIISGNAPPAQPKSSAQPPANVPITASKNPPETALNSPAATSANPVRDKWLSLGAEKSVLGNPIADEEITADGDKIARFQHGLIRWTPGRGARVELNVVTLPRKTVTR